MYDGTDKCERIDYLALWNRKYTGKWDGTFETRDYFDQLVAKLNQSFGQRLSHPVRVIPVGEVMARFEQAIRDGKTSGITSITDLYTDNAHLNATGQYLVGLTFYATMFDADVTSLTARGYGPIDLNVAQVIQECVMEVVRDPER